MTIKRNKLWNYLDNNDLKYLKYLKYTLDSHIYYFGNHYTSHFEKNNTFLKKIKINCIDFIICGSVIINSIFSKKSKKNFILSTAYYLGNKNIEGNFIITRPPWTPGLKNVYFNDFKFFLRTKAIKDKINNWNFNQLIDLTFQSEIEEYKSYLKSYIIENNVKAIFLNNSMGFFEKLAIDIFKELKLPSFEFIHGLPGIYNDYVFGSTDYLVVWGNAIKINFEKYGIPSEKILISGHPLYHNINIEKLKFSCEDILIMPKVYPAAPMSDENIMSDRSEIIFYLLTIQKSLKKLGISKARLRPHPSQNSDWLFKFIDNNFFSLDSATLSDSLNRSTLVIGPTSSIFLESLIYGVNYIVYEPLIKEDTSLGGYKLVPPFDGKNKKVPIAHSEKELIEIISNKITNDASIIDDYIAPKFSLDSIINQIDQS